MAAQADDTTRAPAADGIPDAVAGLRARLPRYSLGPLFIIMAVGAVDFADRAVLAAVFDDVKAEFGVGDTALGLLAGAYFGLATLSFIPCGILADRWNRVRLIALGFIPWSVGMFLQSAAGSFAMMFGARMLLGSIEASNGPSAQSLIGDYYPVERRSRVLGIWRLGEVIGSAIAFASAGVIATMFGWRASFAAFGLLGVLCAGVVVRYLPEPPRGITDALFAAEQRAGIAPADAGIATTPDVDTAYIETVSLRDAFGRLVRIRTAWIMALAAGVGDFFFTGLGSWTTSFFRRYHGLDAATASAVMSVVLLTVVAGALVGGRYSDRLVREGRGDQRVVLAAFGFGAASVMVMVAFALDSLPLAIALLAVAGFFLYLPVPALWAMWIDIIPAHLRGRAGSVSSVLRVAFIAVGPAAIGVLSDRWNLRAAFLIVAPALAINGLLLLLARHTYEPDAAAARADAAALAAR